MLQTQGNKMKHLINNTMNAITPMAIMVGRALLGLYFVLPGILKFVAWDMHVALMEQHGMVFIPFFLASAAIIQIIAGLGIIFNRYTAIFSLILAGLVIVININLHDFWNVATEQQNFVKNMAIFAGLLVLAGFSWKEKNKALSS